MPPTSMALMSSVVSPISSALSWKAAFESSAIATRRNVTTKRKERKLLYILYIHKCCTHNTEIHTNHLGADWCYSMYNFQSRRSNGITERNSTRFFFKYDDNQAFFLDLPSHLLGTDSCYSYTP